MVKSILKATVRSSGLSLSTAGAALAGAAFALASTPSASHGAIITGTSNGYGLNVGLTALGVLDLAAGPVPTGTSGSAPLAYNTTNTIASTNVTSSVAGVVNGAVTAGLISATAASNVDGTPGSKTTSASAAVNNANIGIGTFLGASVLGLNATVTTQASITGDYGALSATGSTVFQSLGLNIGAITVPLGAYVGVNVAPNTSVNLSLLGITGATLVLNEQTIAPGDSSITVNALDLNLNVLGSLTVAGNVTLGHSQAAETSSSVPEPSTAALLGLGAVSLATIRRPRDRRAVRRQEAVRLPLRA